MQVGTSERGRPAEAKRTKPWLEARYEFLECAVSVSIVWCSLQSTFLLCADMCLPSCETLAHRMIPNFSRTPRRFEKHWETWVEVYEMKKESCFANCTSHWHTHTRFLTSTDTSHILPMAHRLEWSHITVADLTSSQWHTVGNQVRFIANDGKRFERGPNDVQTRSTEWLGQGGDLSYETRLLLSSFP